MQKLKSNQSKVNVLTGGFMRALGCDRSRAATLAHNTARMAASFGWEAAYKSILKQERAQLRRANWRK